MSAIMMDGRAVAEKWKTAVAQRTQELIEQGVTPHLAVILVGENAASQVYVRNKENACSRVGIRSTIIRLPEACTQEELENAVLSLNQDESVHGILVQLPLPKELNEARVLALIDPDKDVDGFHAMNSGRLMNGQPRFVPCTPLGVMKLLEAYDIPVRGKHAVIIGRSNIVGKPMAILLLRENATVTICHSHTKDLKEVCKRADILVAAIGKPKFFNRDYIKEGAVVIDVGIHRNEQNKLCGDVDRDDVMDLVSAITPVPGGVGPMTIAMLMYNCVEAVRLQKTER